MKKFLAIILLLVSVNQLAKAQTITVAGTVKDKLGNYLHYAFVQDKQYKYATYTDSVGNFTITANTASTLSVSCYGYQDTTFNVDNKTNFQIVLSNKEGVVAALPSATSARESGNNITHSAVLQDFATANSNSTGHQFNLNSGASVPLIQHKDETEGSRYLYKDWVHGYVVSAQDSIVQNPAFVFNYDKIGGALLLSQDRVSAIEVNRELVKSFTLYDNSNTPEVFENMPDVDPHHYVQVIASGKKYKIYKTIKTKFVTADYTTNGIASSGNNFDSYQDNYEYYILNLQNNTREKLDLKKKSIKSDFANEPEKVNKYITDHSSDSIDESYLTNLGSYMNE